MPVLIAKSGATAGQRFEFHKDIEIGRGPKLDLSLENATISRRHAALSFSSSGCSITDLRSANGTAVNGRLIKKPTRLHHGDEVRLGDVLFEFRWDEGPLPAERKESLVALDDSAQAVLHSMGAADPLVSLLPGSSDRQSIEAMRQRLHLLYDVGVAISQTLEEDSMLSLILEKLFDVFPQADRGFIMAHEPAEGRLWPKAGRSRSGESSKMAISRSLVWDVINKRQGILSTDVRVDGRFSESKSMKASGVRSLVCVPMIANEQILGIIALDSAQSARAFGQDDMALLVAIAGQAALSLANARLHRQLVSQELIERDLALARKIQARFLPKSSPEVDGYDFRDYYVPALEVGGDYYDFLELPGNHILIALGDVSGKGVSAALYMVKLSSEIRYHSAGQTEPAEILKRVNKSISTELEEGMFVTAIVVVLNAETNELRIASAGHMPPLVRRADGSVVALPSPRNTPLGVVGDAVFEQRAFELRSGDTVVLLTDGIPEATNKSGQLFGEERLIEAMRASHGTPEGVMKGILSAVEDFLGGEPQNDDITLLCFGPVSERLPQLKPTKQMPALQ